MEKQLLKTLSFDLRKKVVELCYLSKGGHVGGSLSSIDLLSSLYFNEMKINPNNSNDPNRDYFILSKGHIAEALYVVLAKRGYFSFEELNNYSKFNSIYFGHPTSKVEGVEINTGALGHGLSIGVGLALASKRLNKTNRCYVLMGDGELAEGSVWEAAMAASHYQLDNLCAIIDRNHLQITGTTEQVMSLEDLKDKWISFGFNVVEIDGHNYDDIFSAFINARNCKNKPTLILANTVKGKGISFMENNPAWHHGILTKEQYQQSLVELEEKKHGKSC